MSPPSVAGTLVMPAGLRDNGLRILRARIAEAFRLMSSGHKEQRKRLDISLSLLSSLIERSKAGELGAMEEIFEHYKGPLFSLIYRYTNNRQAAEDLLQDVFIKVFTHIRDVQKMETFVAWIYRIALNACYSHLRSKRAGLRQAVSLSEVEGRKEEAVYSHHEESLERSLGEAIQGLPDKLRTVLLLHDVQGFKHEEISRLLGFTVGTSKSQLFKARMRVREHLRNKKVLGEEKR
jgi:RNA polymerase sigma-70 factor (ECF subfamily)